MKEKFLNFMKERYGFDILNLIIFYFSIGISIINLFKKSNVLSVTSLILLLIVFLRAFSKNKRKRAMEQIKFFNFFSPIYAKLLKFKSKDLKNYKYFKCKNCKKELRVPRGKGKIKITCPNCKHEEIIKS
ncbi:MAG: hypothetical protein PT934_05015 [Peptoniphilaceae bacterium]|uniref:hypothetical protein n=1 Tax=Parvimonas sp. TaxID=1944660 RepID=UPI0025DD954B|nr:hypothetical protein [Parvimonas sp.]MCI5997961.1 hypothetical protein [Parvimonas sp.]MDD7765111.1 hypothetical protein [Peptoniphilaceae bacterium]MDY3051481.1 hypothetical protein [Parvimonas sp.]